MMQLIQQKIKTALTAFLLLITALVTLPFLLFSLMVRALVWVLARVLRPDLESFVTGEAALFATSGTQKSASNIIVVNLYSGALSVDNFVRDIEERVLKAKDPLSGNLLFEKLKKTWEGFLGYAFWKTDLKFNVKSHVREYDYGGEIKLGSTCELKELRSVIGGLCQAKWDRSRSPWELLVKRNVIDVDGEVCSATIFRIGHVLADGYSILGIFKALCQSPFSVPDIKSSRREFSPLEKLALVGKIPWDYAEMMVGVSSARPLKWTDCQKSKSMLTCVSPIIPVELIKRIKDHFGVSYGAVVYSLVLGAIDRAVQATGQTAPEALGVSLVLPTLGHPKKGMVVNATQIDVSFTLKAADPGERLLRVNRELTAIAESSASLVAPALCELIALLPISLRELIKDFLLGGGLTAGITNFPVTSTPEFYNGHAIKSLLAAEGTWEPLAMNVTTGGVNNKQIFQFSVELSVFSDPQAVQSLGLYIADEIHALVDQIEPRISIIS